MQNMSVMSLNLNETSKVSQESTKSSNSSESFQSYMQEKDSAEVSAHQGTPPAKVSSAGVQEKLVADENSVQDEVVQSADVEDVLPLGEEILEVEGKINQLIMDVVKEELNLDDATLETIMTAMGITPMQLLQPEVLKQFVMELNGSSDVTGFLTDETMMVQLNQLMESFESIDWQEMTGFSKETFSAILHNLTDSQATVPNMEHFVEPVPVTVSENLATAVSSQNPQEKQDVNVPVPVEGTEKQEMEKGETVTVVSQQETSENSESGLNQSQGKDTSGSSSGESMSGLIREEDSVQKQVSSTVAGTVNFADTLIHAGDTAKVLPQTKMQQMIDIVNQVTDRIRTSVHADSTTMEMQLNPEQLGKVLLTVSARDGIMTASFVVESQEAKEALESQMFLLRENLEQKELKVDEVEVFVSDFPFDQSSQGDSQDTKEFSQGNGKSTKYDFESEEEDSAADEAEQNRRSVTGDSGSSIDYIA